MVPEHITRYFDREGVISRGKKRKVWTVRATVESPKTNTAGLDIYVDKNKDEDDDSRLERAADGPVAECP